MIKQNKKKYFALFSTFIILITAALISCNDSPVSTNKNYIFDHPRFSWDADTITGDFIYDGWYYDTNKIFLLTGNSILKYDGFIFTHYAFQSSFTSYCITGYDENNVYIGGSYINSNNESRAMLKKWTGAAFVDFSLDETGVDQADKFFTVYSPAQNELWLSASKGKVYRFDGNNFQTFNFDTNYSYIAPFMKDEVNNIYFAGKIYYGTNGIDSTHIELQEYNNLTWGKIYTSTLHSGQTDFFTQNIGNELFAISNQQIYKFNGLIFDPALKIDAFLLLDGTVSGTSISSLTCKGNDGSTQTDCLFNWNGNKWSKELTFQNRDYTKIIYSNNERAYVIDYNYVSGKTYFMKGRKKL